MKTKGKYKIFVADEDNNICTIFEEIIGVDDKTFECIYMRRSVDNIDYEDDGMRAGEDLIKDCILTIKQMDERMKK